MNLNAKYRPATFSDIVGQNVTVTILNKMLETGKIRNCLAFVGDSGTGKTTAARCFAAAINHGVGFPIEIDAASYGNVAQIREIIASANERALAGEYKVYIIDEAHMLTTEAWNALLKTIEEPPKYTIFIFCTTNASKIPATILNRVQRYTFAKLSSTDIKNRLCFICKNEGIINYEEACDFLAKTCQGSMRSAITNLEQCLDYSTDLTLDNIKKVLGGLSYEVLFKLTWALTQPGREQDIFTIIEELFLSGQDLKQFIDIYLEFILNLIKYQLFNDIELTTIPGYLASENNQVVQFTVNIEQANLIFNKILDTLLNIKTAIKYDTNFKITIESMLLKLARELA